MTLLMHIFFQNFYVQSHLRFGRKDFFFFGNKQIRKSINGKISKISKI